MRFLSAGGAGQGASAALDAPRTRPKKEIKTAAEPRGLPNYSCESAVSASGGPRQRRRQQRSRWRMQREGKKMYTDGGEDSLSPRLVVTSFRLLKRFEAFCGVILL